MINLKDKTTRELLEILKKAPRGLNISEVTAQSNYSRLTVSKYLLIMSAEGLIELRDLGSTKLFYCIDGVGQ